METVHNSPIASDATGGDRTLQTSKQLSGIFSNGGPIEAERPPFPTTPEQRSIGPLPLDPTDPSVAIPAPINRFLRDYQREGVKFFYNSYRRGVGGILGDDMG